MALASSIIFLGTGGDTYVVSRQHRTSAGIILQVGDDQYHIDPGPSSLFVANAAGINPRANTAVFVTHNHVNHANDVNAIVDAMTYNGFDKRGIIAGARSVLEGTKNQIPFLQPFYKSCLERVILMEPGKRLAINDTEIHALNAKHDDPHAIGLKFMTPEFTISYSGDTEYSPDIAMQYEHSNVLILNVPYLEKKEGKNNLCKEDAVRIIGYVKPRLAIITHFGANFAKADPIYEIREIQKQTNIQVIAVRDGMIINPQSYAVEQGQKTIYKYARSAGTRVTEYSVEHEKKVAELNDIINEKQLTLLDSDDKQHDSIPNDTTNT